MDGVTPSTRLCGASVIERSQAWAKLAHAGIRHARLHRHAEHLCGQGHDVVIRGDTGQPARPLAPRLARAALVLQCSVYLGYDPLRHDCKCFSA
jgi:hypothetical protein